MTARSDARAVASTWLLPGAGLVLCGLLLASLARLFQLEAREAESALEARQAALDGYAVAQVEERLKGFLAEERARQDACRKDVLLPDDGLFLAEAGRRLVPSPAPRGERDDEWLRHPGRLAVQRTEPGEERLALIVEVSQQTDRAKKERAVRTVLGHMEAFQLPVAESADLTLTLVELLKKDISPRLARALLRDGLELRTPDWPQRVPGLMRNLIAHADQLTASELAQLCQRTVLFALPLDVRTDDFDRRCAAVHRRLPPLEVPAGLWVWRGDDTWVLGSDGHEVRGVRFDAPTVALQVTAAMRSLGILPRDGAVTLTPVPPGEPRPVEFLAARLESQEWARTRDDIGTRLQLKLGLLAGAGFLALLSSGLWLLAQRRKHRFVDLKAGFVAAVSHELRTPLASVQLMAETLERRLEGEPRAKDYPARIVQEVEQLSFLVENILSFNRLERGKWTPDRAPVPLEPLGHRLHDEAARYPHAKVQLTLRGLEGMSAYADAALLELLLRNLIRNACAYNERDPVELTLDALKEEGHLALRLKDNGVGIAEEDAERVFDEFERLPPSRGRGGSGSGLGLALCRGIALAHGGRLSLEQSSPEGSVFLLELPEP